MRYVDEYRNVEIIRILEEKIKGYNGEPLTFMEVCGTHTMALSSFGLRELLPENIRLISGPGCPVCVTSNADIDKIIEYSALKDVIIATFGDMLKVPGTRSSLSKERAKGANVRVVYFIFDALKIAEENPEKKVVFVSVGFETTVPGIAYGIKEAKKRALKNFFVFCSNKTVPKALEALITLGEIKINGFILPGHVSTIIGVKPYEVIPKKYGIGGVIAGFEATDILWGIWMLLNQFENQSLKIEIQYKRVVRPEGNQEAQSLIAEVFEETDAEWRGIGIIPGTGLKLKEDYGEFDIQNHINVDVSYSKEPEGCSCGEILRGVKYPYQCALFKRICTPENPVGPCMVSSEGSCAAYYKYGSVTNLKR